MAINLYEHQKLAVDKLKSGSILCGGVGSGKSRTAIYYYYTKECMGRIKTNGQGGYSPMKKPKDLYIITTAKKRDSLEWELECSPFVISNKRELSNNGVQLTVDSWNNISKYVNVKNAFFILDEQRIVGSGTWVKSFYKIAEKNNWILLSATPGDTWSDYIPVFVANRFYKNKTQFLQRHAVYNRFSRYPKIDRYVEESRLLKCKREILVEMKYEKPTIAHDKIILTEYDKETFNQLVTKRWNHYENKPVKTISELCYLMRKVVNSDPSRITALNKLIEKHPRIIIFYNFDYELEILRKNCWALNIHFAEWNGHNHHQVPTSERWVYLVQYTAGAEGWNCITTDTIVFFSMNYSYKIMVQSAGRIDRLNTTYRDLYYYHIRSSSLIDLAIAKSLKKKKDFNINYFMLG